MNVNSATDRVANIIRKVLKAPCRSAKPQVNIVDFIDGHFDINLETVANKQEGWRYVLVVGKCALVSSSIVFSLCLSSCYGRNANINDLSLGFQEWRDICLPEDEIGSVDDIIRRYPPNKIGKYASPLKIQCVKVDKLAASDLKTISPVLDLTNIRYLLNNRNCNNVHMLVQSLQNIISGQDLRLSERRPLYGAAEAAYVIGQISDQCGPQSVNESAEDAYLRSYNYGLDYNPRQLPE